MKLFAIALGIVCSIAIIVFGVVFAVLLPSLDFSESVYAAAIPAGLPFLTLPGIAEFLERKVGRRTLAAGKSASVHHYREFQLPWPITVIYGFLVLITLDVISTFVAALAAAISSGSVGVLGEDFFEHLFLFALAINLPALMVGGYFVGRWIGTRCSWRGIVAVLLTSLLVTAAAMGLIALTPAETYDQAFLFVNLGQFPLVLFCGLIGYRRGRKARSSKYLGYLLDVLPPAARDAVVELAIAEAQKAVAAANAPPAHSPSA